MPIDIPSSRRAEEEKIARADTPAIEILQFVAEGHSAKEAAAILNLSPRTVEFHKYRLMQQLGLKTTFQLIEFAIKHKIISR